MPGAGGFRRVESYWQRSLSRRRALVLSGAGAVAAALAACNRGDAGDGDNAYSGLVAPIVDETKSMARGGSYRSVLGTPPTLDPHASGSHVIHGWLNYSQLLKIKPGYLQGSDGDVEGEIIESWEVSPDKLTITGRLAQDTRFAPVAPVNGRAVDIQDVLFSWRRSSELSPRRNELVNTIDAGAPITSISAPDARTLVIKLSRPMATILAQLTGGSPGTFYIVPKEAENTAALNLRATMAGSGPFFLHELVPNARAVFRRNPGFRLDRRNVPYVDELAFADLPEYATQLAQFKSGGVYDTFTNLQPDDILPTKRDAPELEITSSQTYIPHNIRAFFGYNADSPFRDERARQAYSLVWDRQLFIEVFSNVAKFREEGLPVAIGFDNALRGQSYAGWWLDPQSKDFGPNGRFFEHNPRAAKKLLFAAGYAAGIDYMVHFGTLAAHTASYGKWVDALSGMARDSSLFRPRYRELDFSTEWQTFRFNKGRFTGQSFIFDTGENDPANDLHSHYHTGGSRYFGPAGAGLPADALLDGLIDKMLQEFDIRRRIALAHEIQRHEGSMIYQPRPGGATSFRIRWPAVRNYNVWQGDNQGRYLATIWLNRSKPPFKRA